MIPKIILALLLGWLVGFMAFFFLPGNWHFSAPLWAFSSTLAFLRITDGA
jgi:hypothetical protein